MYIKYFIGISFCSIYCSNMYILLNDIYKSIFFNIQAPLLKYIFFLNKGAFIGAFIGYLLTYYQKEFFLYYFQSCIHS